MTASSDPGVNGLSAAQRAEFESELRAAGIQLLEDSGVSPRPPGALAPLSFAQERLWFLDQLDPGSAAYNVAGAVRLAGALDVAALRVGLDDLVARHETLRTTFEAGPGGAPVQRVHPPGRVELPVAEAGSDAAEAALAAQEASCPFDLSTGPLLRVRLLRRSPVAHTLLLTMHHIITDGWSLGVIVGELAHLYDTRHRGQEPALPELACQYADYAIWQRDWLQGEVLDRQLGYWRGQLAGLPVLALPTDHPRPPVESHRGHTVSFTLPPTLTTALRELCQREGVTLFMALLAAFWALLSRYTGQTDIAVGTPIAGRGRPELDHLVGFFVNTLVLRGDVSGNPTFAGLLARARATALAAYEHQDLPFERLVEDLQPQRTLAHSPLFQVMLSVQHTPAHEPEFHGLSVSVSEPAARTAKFDLTLFVREEGTQLAGEFEYAADLFEPATIERMASHFWQLLAAAVAAPDAPCAILPVLSATEREQLLRLGRGTPASYPDDSPLERLFLAQAARTPAAAAVSLTDGRWFSYRELEQRAARLACHLRSLGVRAETLVAVCLELSPDLVVALVAILQAGGAYLVLDPSQAPGQLASQLARAAPAVVITRKDLATRFGRWQGLLLVLDHGDEWPADPGEGGLELLRGGERLACVLYSPSSGESPGTLCTHRGLINRLQWYWRAHPFRPGERCCLVASPASADTQAELFGALLAGVPAVLVPESADTGHHLLAGLLAAGDVTRVTLTPSLLRAFLDTCPDPDKILPALSLVSTGGEALGGDLSKRFFAALPGRLLVNVYGSSETGVASCFDADQAAVDGPVPIGRPIANTQFYVLDAQSQLLPAGFPGELYVEGPGIARGYLNDPRLTAERFLPNPFADGQGARLYRTRDRVRWLPDGNLAFLGRAGMRLHLRGRGIDPLEIEHTLHRHPAVREAAIVRHEAGPGEEGLTAFVATGGQPLGIDELRAYLGQTLPEYLLPSRLVHVAALPLTRSGKLDRESSPALADAEPQVAASSGSVVERLVALVMADILERDQVGTHDNFFDLGGHSLLATVLLTQLEDALGVKMPLRRFFEVPTAAGCARIAIEASADRWELDRRAELTLEVLCLSDEDVARMNDAGHGRAGPGGKGGL